MIASRDVKKGTSDLALRSKERDVKRTSKIVQVLWAAANRGLNRQGYCLVCAFVILEPHSCSFVVWVEGKKKRPNRSKNVGRAGPLNASPPAAASSATTRPPSPSLLLFFFLFCFSPPPSYCFVFLLSPCAPVRSLIQHHVVAGLVSACTRRGQGKDWICQSASTLVRPTPWPGPPPPAARHPSPPPGNPHATRAHRTHPLINGARP